MIQVDLEQEAKKLKDSIVESINNFRGATNVWPLVDIKIKETITSCDVMREIQVSVKVSL